MKVLLVFFLSFLFLFTPLRAGEDNSFNRVRTYDVQHYTIRLSFDRIKKMVFSDSTIELKPLSDNFKVLELDAREIKFQSIKLESNDQILTYETTPEKVIINLDKAYQKGEPIAIRFKYSIQPKKGIYFVKALRRRGKITRHHQIWTQGESQETHYWLPSFDFPDDKATTEQIITVNKGETVIGNGQLLSKKNNPDGTLTFHYRMEVPHSLYLTSFIVGTYEKVTENYKNIPISYYVYPGSKSIVPSAYGKTKDMFRIFEEVTGIDYPYNKYDQTMVADFQFGGMENITATTMADSEILMARFVFARPLVEDLVSHELSHSWFGNLVTCRNWSELWLNEGFATYMEAVFREKMYGRANYIEKIESDASEFFTYISLREESQHALFNKLANPQNDDTLFTPITYQKGSVVIHMLREEIGDEAFWKGINVYLNRFKFANVETPDLQNVLEEVSGKKLDWFFKQWVYQTGFPKLNVQPLYNQKQKILTLNFSQIQKGNEDMPKEFTLPLEIEILSSNGKETKQILVNKKLQSFAFPVTSKPQKITIDKNYKIPLKDLRQSKLIIKN